MQSILVASWERSLPCVSVSDSVFLRGARSVRTRHSSCVLVDTASSQVSGTSRKGTSQCALRFENLDTCLTITTHCPESVTEHPVPNAHNLRRSPGNVHRPLFLLQEVLDTETRCEPGVSHDAPHV